MRTAILILFNLFLSSHVVADSAFYDRPEAWEEIEHIVVVMLENTSYHEALAQPFLQEVANRGALLSKYYAVTHPSQPNYIALSAGDFFNLNTDHNVDIDSSHLGDLIENKGLTWKIYAEDYPENGFLGRSSGLYVRKHVPFLSFVNVQNNPVRLQNVVNMWRYFYDEKYAALPSFSFFIPNLNNDGHDTGVAYASVAMQTYLGSLINDPVAMEDTLLIITFDEDAHKIIDTDNRIYAAFIGAGVKPGTISDVKYDHYSLLRTIEEIYELGTLGRNDTKANIILDIWQ